MLIITDSGKTHLKTLQGKEGELSDYMNEVNRTQTYEKLNEVERKRFRARIDAKHRRVYPQLFILDGLSNGPKERTEFYFPKTQQLSEGRRRIHDTAQNRVINELVTLKYVTEV